MPTAKFILLISGVFAAMSSISGNDVKSWGKSKQQIQHTTNTMDVIKLEYSMPGFNTSSYLIAYDRRCLIVLKMQITYPVWYDNDISL